MKTRKLLLAVLFLLPVFANAATPSIGDDKASAFKGTQKVAIAEFGVEFYTQLAAESHKNSGASARFFATLQGVGDADFQAVTEKAYADTVAALKAAGFEVVDQSALAANKGYQALVKKYGETSPYTFTDSSIVKSEPNVSLIYAPAGMPAFFSSSMIRGGFGQRVDAQNQKRGAKEGKVAKELGATLLHIHYLVGFAQPYADKNNALFSSSWAHAGAEFGDTLFPDDSEWQFVTASGARTFTTSKRGRHSGALYLKEPLQSAAGNIFGSRDATTGADKRSDATTEAVGAIGALMSGGHGFGQKTKRAALAPPSADAWQQDVNQLLSQATAAFTSDLAAQR